jgi:hypothetical protein
MSQLTASVFQVNNVARLVEENGGIRREAKMHD